MLTEDREPLIWELSFQDDTNTKLLKQGAGRKHSLHKTMLTCEEARDSNLAANRTAVWLSYFREVKCTYTYKIGDILLSPHHSVLTV